jgi:hypothetical protein
MMIRTLLTVHSPPIFNSFLCSMRLSVLFVFRLSPKTYIDVRTADGRKELKGKLATKNAKKSSATSMATARKASAL